MSALLLIVVFAAFANSFFFRTYQEHADAKPHVIVHGIAFTIWFVIAFTQTCLVAAHRTRVHRQLGIAGLTVAAAVVVTGVVTLARRDAPVIDDDPQAAFGLLVTMIGFSICIVAGMLLRKRPAAHKRLMLMASFSIIVPAIDRLAGYVPSDGFFAKLVAGIAKPPQEVAAWVATASLFLAILIHDLISQKHPHKATIAGILVVYLLAPGISAALTSTGMWAALVRLVT